MHVIKKKGLIKLLEFKLKRLEGLHEDLIERYIKEQDKNESLEQNIDFKENIFMIISIILVTIIAILICSLCTL